jgi:hypothetical protein
LDLFDGKVYLLGGWDGTPHFRNDVGGRFHVAFEVFDLASNRFLETDLGWTHNIPPRRAFTAVSIGQTIVFAGGLDVGGHNDLFGDVVALDPRTGGFSRLAPVVEDERERKFSSPGIGAVDQTLFLAGGQTIGDYGSAEISKSIYRLDSLSSAWVKVPEALHEGKCFVEVIPLSSTRVGFLAGHQGYLANGQPGSPVTHFEYLDLK